MAEKKIGKYLILNTVLGEDIQGIYKKACLHNDQNSNFIVKIV